MTRPPLLAFALLLAAALALEAAGPRVLPEGKTPADTRLAPLKDLDGYFPFDVPQSKEEWAPRAERVRRQVQVSQGLWPMPEKTPLNPVIRAIVDFKDYSVSRVVFESLPGFYVTGNLYWPAKDGKRLTENIPVVLCPHGHWPNGRFLDVGREATRKEIVNGAERFEDSGRSPLQARCVQLARMGCAVFHYDMLGYADSVQLSFELVHRFGKQRPEMNTAENWGLYSPQAESRLQSVMGLQTLNSVRSLDFVLGLRGIDPKRVAVTGASGGGTQTFLLAAIDDRVAVAWPAVMVSTAMQGGCTCENCSVLRVHTGNIELAALFAPKPLGMTAANDWTKEMETKGFPELKRHYELLGAKDNVTLKALLHFGHNYNQVSRAAMYSWFNKHLKLGQEEPVVEDDYERLSTEQLSVWDAKHPKPEGGPDFERKLAKQLNDDSEKQLAAVAPKDSGSLEAFRKLVGGAIDAIVGRGLPKGSDVSYTQNVKNQRDGHLEMAGLVRYSPRKGETEELPIVFLYPKEWNGEVTIWLDDDGKSGLYAKDGRPRDAIRALLEKGKCVVSADLLFQGEFLADGQPVTETRKVGNNREFAGYTFGYNDTLVAQRAHDALTLVSYIRNHEMHPKKVDLVGLRGMAPVVALARAQAREAVDRAAIDTEGFRFAKLASYRDIRFLPGGAKYGDLPGLLALAAPSPVWIAGEEKTPDLVAAAYTAAGNKDAAVLGKGEEALVAWLTK